MLRKACWWDKAGISGKWNRCKVDFKFSDWQILIQYDNICLRWLLGRYFKKYNMLGFRTLCDSDGEILDMAS